MSTLRVCAERQHGDNFFHSNSFANSFAGNGPAGLREGISQSAPNSAALRKRDARQCA
jgi:hypothetical protein